MLQGLGPHLPAPEERWGVCVCLTQRPTVRVTQRANSQVVTTEVSCHGFSELKAEVDVSVPLLPTTALAQGGFVRSRTGPDLIGGRVLDSMCWQASF